MDKAAVPGEQAASKEGRHTYRVQPSTFARAKHVLAWEAGQARWATEGGLCGSVFGLLHRIEI